GVGHPRRGGYTSRMPKVATVCPTFFNVRIDYGTVPKYQDPVLDMPAQISWDDATSTEPVDEDADGKPMVNPVDEPYDPPMTEEFSDSVLRIVRNEAAFTPDTPLTYRRTTCAHVFYGAPRGRSLMKLIRANQVTGSPTYWQVTYEIHFRMQTAADVPAEKAWWRRVLCQGYREKVITGTTGGGAQLYAIRSILDAYGQPMTRPTLLTLDGFRLPAGLGPEYLPFKRFQERVWTPLGLE
ncbi:MAG TPA: hypothetical protein VMW52_05710, partial [Phycisphaerae bacterium]|nr:hypothetical protein [Phycisphaerae bacterium]